MSACLSFTSYDESPVVKPESASGLKNVGVVDCRGFAANDPAPRLGLEECRDTTASEEKVYQYAPNPVSWIDPLGLTCKEYTYDELKDLAENTLDFGTKKDGAVFWGTPNMLTAQAWADIHGKTTLEQTKGGKFLNDLDLFGPDSKLSGTQAKHIWDIASKRFAEGASGDINVFSTGATRFSPFGERTWWKIEKPALLKNADVNSVTRRKKDGTPAKTGHIKK